MQKKRECGPCTLCCTTSAVPELAKPFGVKCEHCAVGCSIISHEDVISDMVAASLVTGYAKWL